MLWYVADIKTRSPGFISSSCSTVIGSVSKRYDWFQGPTRKPKSYLRSRNTRRSRPQQSRNNGEWYSESAQHFTCSLQLSYCAQTKTELCEILCRFGLSLAESAQHFTQLSLEINTLPPKASNHVTPGYEYRWISSRPSACWNSMKW